MVNDVNTSSVAVDDSEFEETVISIEPVFMQSIVEYISTNFPDLPVAEVAVSLRVLSDMMANEAGFDINDGEFKTL